MYQPSYRNGVEFQRATVQREDAPQAALRVKVYAGRRWGRVAPGRGAAGLKELGQCVTVTTPRRTRTMNITMSTSQMLLMFIQSPPPS